MTRAEQIFHEALEQRAEERDAFVDRRCAGDADLRREVRELLAFADADDPIGPWVSAEADALVRSFETPRLAIGDEVGPYRIVSALGRGGMGEVWLAERADGAYDKQVAIKVHRGGLLAESDLSRFVRERQILASLEHPGIARLLDGATLPDGTPYLVMESIDGSPIDEHCRDRSLGIRERLELFLRVCEAVEHAHRSLIVHRDLKPANLLVTPDGVVKVLDFGVAGLVDENAETGKRALTLNYASPEQLDGARSTQLTDVYALGVVLYELLTGTRPYEFESRDPTAIREQISSAPPVSPSCYARLGADLDAIVLRAMRAEPSERFPTVERLRSDIEAFLGARPVAARKAGLWHRARLFAQRHTAATGIATFAIVGLGAFAAYHTVELRTERNAAIAQAETTQQIVDFMTGVFEATGPGSDGGEAVSARELLDRAAEVIREDLVRAAPQRSRLLRTIAEAYRGLALPDEAEALAREAVALMERQGDPQHPEYLASLSELAAILAYRSKADEAATLIEKVIANERGGDLQLAFSWINLAEVLSTSGQHERALELSLKALGEYDRLVDPDHPRRLTALRLIAKSLVELERLDEAERYLDEHLRLSVAEPARRASALLQISRIAELRGQLERAAEYRADYVTLLEGLYPPGHNTLAIAHNNYASALDDLGRDDEAERYYRRAIEAMLGAHGPENPIVARFRLNLAALQSKTGDCDEAISTYDEVCAMRRETLGDENVQTAICWHNKTYGLLECGYPARAEEPADTSLAMWRATVGNEHRIFGIALGNRARLASALARDEQAESFARRAIEVLTAAVGSDHPETQKNRLTLALLLAKSGRADEARASAESLREELSALDDLRDERLARLELVLGFAALADGDPRSAGEAFGRAIDHARDEGSTAKAIELQARAALADALGRTGETAAAADRARAAIAFAEREGLANSEDLARAQLTLATSLEPSPERDLAMEQAGRILRAGYPAEHPLRRAWAEIQAR